MRDPSQKTVEVEVPMVRCKPLMFQPIFVVWSLFQQAVETWFFKIAHISSAASAECLRSEFKSRYVWMRLFC